jgi:formamidopyrimidine-DNA glycosylase
MPELPEVETTRRGLEPFVVGESVASLTVRERRLRWPLARDLARHLQGREILSLGRRGKYLLINVPGGSLIVHLGMSGSLRIVPQTRPAGSHDHVDINLSGGTCLRFNDPRRFGSMHFSAHPEQHKLLKSIGPEPLGDDFSADYLWQVSRQRRVAIKQHLMNGRIVAGVGNIYANEALFRAGIRPTRAAGRIARARFTPLIDSIRGVLTEALGFGGTTLRDFVGGDGRPGYFQQSLRVYDRAGQPCVVCADAIKLTVQGQRATYYCARCQR